MSHIETDKFKVIVNDEKRKLYLRNAPLYRGMTRWNSFRKQALRFSDMAEATAAVESLGDKDLDIIYEMVDEGKDDGKESVDQKFMVEIALDGAYTVVYWNAKDKLEILDRAVLLAKNSKSNLLSVIVEERKTTTS